jgi:hypothetical protein
LFFAKVAIGEGESQGTLVFTGQPNPSKHREFVFFDPTLPDLPVGGGVFHDFERNHSSLNDERHGGDDEPNPEWKYWRKRLDAGEKVPIFYLEEAGKVSSIGLAQMYRLAYRNSVGEMIAHTNDEHVRSAEQPWELDFAEALFGRVGQESERDGGSLRGRVSVGMFRCDRGGNLGGVVRGVLSQPKPTFYPAYIRQRSGNGDQVQEYRTYMSEEAEVRGWKRYPVRAKHESPTPPGGEQENVASSWRAWDAGSEFHGFIRFHNLKPAELGAILWAIDFGKRPQARHVLGHAKPFGFGAVRLTLDEAPLLHATGREPVLTPEAYVECFERHMDREIHMDRKIEKARWKETEQIVQLLAMADKKNAERHVLQYMVLSSEEGRRNDFVKAKKDKRILPDYVEMRPGALRDKDLFPRRTPAERERIKREADMRRRQQQLNDEQVAKPVGQRVAEVMQDVSERPSKDRLQRLLDVAALKKKALQAEIDETAFRRELRTLFAGDIADIRCIADGQGPAARDLAQKEARLSQAGAKRSKDDVKARDKAQESAQKEATLKPRCDLFIEWIDG